MPVCARPCACVWGQVRDIAEPWAGLLAADELPDSAHERHAARAATHTAASWNPEKGGAFPIPCPSPPCPSVLCGNPGGPGRAQFVAGLGLGSASVAWHLSEWALASVGGFSGAVARVLQRSTARSPADSCALPGRSRRAARPTRPGLHLWPEPSALRHAGPRAFQQPWIQLCGVGWARSQPLDGAFVYVVGKAGRPRAAHVAHPPAPARAGPWAASAGGCWARSACRWRARSTCSRPPPPARPRRLASRAARGRGAVRARQARRTPRGALTQAARWAGRRRACSAPTASQPGAMLSVQVLTGARNAGARVPSG
jgi:hypothetical protein